MRIGILGSGRMADALGGRWAQAGHEVLVGGRSPERAKELALRIGSQHGTLQDAAEFGEVTLLAVSAEAADGVLRTVGAPDGSLAGRPLIDCTNSVDQRDLTLAEPAMAERISELSPGAAVVKAFNLAADPVWRSTPQTFEGRPLGVPLCGDDEAALVKVEELVRALGGEPVRAGGLARARLLEATAAFAIGIWFGGGDTRALFPPLAHAF
ncbi:hypothetical protein FB561_5100 [Kribbella amoyensis]|uniref:Pyrroline-5-carboxylate reductase catalytic N-terminal domain-containing protein n=1 Tax=Kribbella amoyensis TaxID=996641 RepID=A0A561BYF9_9ACTN|nr:NAD(P)-binding domain-containing protein [Kribbella amoyensis]TWD83929.1 hypothetical protein FB561_5100 [Kribbella amoyensis]